MGSFCHREPHLWINRVAFSRLRPRFDFICALVHQMAPKRSRATSKERLVFDLRGPRERSRSRSPPTFAFRDRLKALYLRNRLSAKDNAELIRNAHTSGAGGVDDLASGGGGEAEGGIWATPSAT